MGQASVTITPCETHLVEASRQDSASFKCGDGLLSQNPTIIECRMPIATPASCKETCVLDMTNANSEREESGFEEEPHSALPDPGGTWDSVLLPSVAVPRIQKFTPLPTRPSLMQPGKNSVRRGGKS